MPLYQTIQDTAGNLPVRGWFRFRAPGPRAAAICHLNRVFCKTGKMPVSPFTVQVADCRHVYKNGMPCMTHKITMDY